VAHGPDAASLDARASIPQLGRQPLLPDVGRLYDVVVDADDPGQLGDELDRI
jgi:hypothetical protein